MVVNVSLRAHLAKWFRSPALKLFGTTRIPRQHCDVLANPSPSLSRSPSQYILVMFREWCYRLLVTDAQGNRLGPDVIEKRLRDTIRDVWEREGRENKPVPVGRLTGDQRDLWAKVSDDHLPTLYILLLILAEEATDIELS